MKTANVLLAAIVALSAPGGGCAAGDAYAHPLHLRVNAPIGRKATAVLYIVAAPKEVRERWWTVDRNDQPHRQVFGMRKFVEHDLADAFGEYYQDVVVVSDESEVPKSNAVIARVQMRTLREGYGFILDWAIALRFSDQPDYFYSYSDSVQSAYVMGPDNLLADCLKSATLRFFQRYTNKGFHRYVVTGQAPPKGSAADDEDGAEDGVVRPRPVNRPQKQPARSGVEL